MRMMNKLLTNLTLVEVSLKENITFLIFLNQKANYPKKLIIIHKPIYYSIR